MAKANRSRRRDPRHRHLTARSGGVIYYQRRVQGRKLFKSTGERDWDAAARFRDAYEHQMGLAPDLGQPSFSPDTFAEVRDRYLEHLERRVASGKTRRSTRDEHRRILARGGEVDRRFGPRPVGLIGKQDLMRWWLETVEEQPIAQSTGLNRLSAVGKVFRYAARTAVITANPCEGLRSHLELRPHFREPRPIDDPEALHRFLEYFRVRAEAYEGRGREADWPRLYLATLLMLDTGMRIGEATGLPWCCVDFSERTIEVRWNLTRGGRYLEDRPKNGRARTVVMSTRLADLLERTRRQRGVLHPDRMEPALDRPDAFVARVAGSHYGRMFRKAKDAAGISDPRVTAHALRHTFASALLSAGHPIALIADAIGDSIPVTERTYARWIRHSRQERPPADDIAEWMEGAQ